MDERHRLPSEHGRVDGRYQIYITIKVKERIQKSANSNPKHMHSLKTYTKWHLTMREDLYTPTDWHRAHELHHIYITIKVNGSVQKSTNSNP